MVERLFFALWPTPGVRQDLVRARGSLAPEPGRLSHPADLHMTLVFVGAVEAHISTCIEAAGDDVVVSAFDLRLEQLGSWRRQAMWVAQPGESPSELLNLYSQLQQNLLSCGLEPEKRPYRPHVTLARKAPAIDPRELQIHWPITDFVLAASRSGRQPAYHVLKRWPLGG